MSQLAKMALAAILVPAIAFVSPAYATTTKGQIEGGNIYRIKNVTKNSDFVDPASADACNELQYRVRIHNPGPSTISNVNVKATLAAGAATRHVSTVTVSASDADPASTSDGASVNLSSSQSLSYVAGSTQLLGANGEFMQTLPDSITTSGVNIGSVGVSIDKKRFVQFKVKVSCPQPTPTPTPTPPVVKQKVTELPDTGAGSVISVVAGASALGAAGHYAFRRFRG